MRNEVFIADRGAGLVLQWLCRKLYPHGGAQSAAAVGVCPADPLV